MLSHRPARTIRLVLAAFASLVMGAASVHCGGSGQTTTAGQGGSGAGSPSGTGGTASGPSGTGGTGGDLTIDVQTKDYSAEDFFEDDPPPLSCDGGGMPKIPGGTPECPDDKNLEGCPCPAQGTMAACWPGKRKNKNHGICHDGMTVCVLNGENTLTWGPCVGYQLPTGPTGKEACTCFSGGHWDIANLSPCFFFDGNNNVTDTVSTSLQGNQIMCPPDPASALLQDWSTNTLKVDCTGHFKLCYTLKAGDGANPQPGDCSIVEVCTESYYSPANATVTFPPLPGWTANPATVACAQQFVDVGGYGEMSVDGQSDECEGVKKVFQHVTYCPLACNDPNPPPRCAMCMPGGGGSF